MGLFFNRWSFYLSFISIGFVFLASSNSMKERIIKWFGIHPLQILFYFTILVLVFGIIGFSAVNNWSSALRSIFTVGFTLVLTVFLAYIIYVGQLLE
ncbi:hypothetical protein [Robertmurraya massiliosenegalensis]|uniref:hypothetical protein n=1 Tax=Robertmurraya massiliosenegalensis TaxID=1287657 RepID=UPI000309B12D|nr:hypothetical protein [Robertmurraya massiliosenegalensis]